MHLWGNKTTDTLQFLPALENASLYLWPYLLVNILPFFMLITPSVCLSKFVKEKKIQNITEGICSVFVHSLSLCPFFPPLVVFSSPSIFTYRQIQ